MVGNNGTQPEQVLIDWNATDDSTLSVVATIIKVIDDDPELWKVIARHITAPGICSTSHDDWLYCVFELERSKEGARVRRYELNPSELLGPLRNACKRKLGKTYVYADGRFTGERKQIAHEKPPT